MINCPDRVPLRTAAGPSPQPLTAWTHLDPPCLSHVYAPMPTHARVHTPPLPCHVCAHVSQHAQQLVAELHMPPPHRLQLVPQHRLLPGGQLRSHLAQALQPLAVLLDGSILDRLPAGGKGGRGGEQGRE